MKLMYLDLETTGTNPEKHGTIQISGIIEIDGEVKERIDYKVAPFNQDIVDPYACQVNGITIEEMNGFQDPTIVYMELMNVLSVHVNKYDRNDKFQIIGYNARFDDDFLRAWFMKNNDRYYGSWFSWPALDLTNLLCFELLGKRHELDNFKLMTVAKHFGIEVDDSKAHDAMYDVEITRKMFMVLKGRS